MSNPDELSDVPESDGALLAAGVAIVLVLLLCVVMFLVAG
jgi:hypothetical protein